MDDVNVALKICKVKGNNSEKNIFKCANFWLSKGVLIQTKGQENHHEALDYYLSGVKIDPRHYGCVYNVACSYFF